MMMNAIDAKTLLKNAKILFRQDELYQCIDKMANELSKEIAEDIPVFLPIMNGGLFFAAELLKRIKSPFIMGYIHASRYAGASFGASHITWYRQPQTEEVKDKHVYVIDDVLDEGYTLAEVKRYLLSVGVRSCKLIVLIDKQIDKPKPITADYVGLTAPNQYLFGFGMDIKGMYRQLTDIYYSLSL